MNTLTPKEKEFTILALIVGVVIILWFWWEKRQAANTASAPAPEQDFGNWPMTDNLPDYSPPTIQLNIANQTPNLLSDKMIPLFGFIGVAQGTYWL
jgi:hypothetical protein